jgi:uncharacterized protein YecE (DUF72 family)
MKFGTVENPEAQDLGLPEANTTFDRESGLSFQAWVGAAKWEKKYLHNFFPKGTKDELGYYASQFNSIEYNATFFKRYSGEQYEQWAQRVPEDFKFFPKLHRWVSHIKRLNGIEQSVREFVDNVSHLGNKLGGLWLLMPENFAPKYLDRIQTFAEFWKASGFPPLSIELRHTDWFNDPAIAPELYRVLQENEIGNIIVDTAGRRDLMHMRLTTPTAFIRWVGCNNAVDYKRLDDWVDRIADWKAQGLRELYFFIHENTEEKIPQLAEHFIIGLNKKTGINLTVPKLTARV